MLRIRDIILTPDEDKPNQLRKKAAAVLGLKPSELKQLHIVRRSIDARKRDRSSNWKSAHPLNPSVCAVLVTVEAFEAATAAMSLTEP